MVADFNVLQNGNNKKKKNENQFKKKNAKKIL